MPTLVVVECIPKVVAKVIHSLGKMKALEDTNVKHEVDPLAFHYLYC